MSPQQYRKSSIEIGKIYFWTATIRNWHPLLSDDKFKTVIIDSLNFLSDQHLIDVFAFVIMPNHIHLIWRINALNGKELPSGSFLKFTAHQFKQMLPPAELALYNVTAPNKQCEFWQRDSLAIELYSPEVIYQKLEYIHNNPLAGKWSLATDPIKYEYSSAAFYESGACGFPFLKHIGNEL